MPNPPTPRSANARRLLTEEMSKRRAAIQRGRAAALDSIKQIRAYIKALTGNTPWIDHVYPCTVLRIERNASGNPTGRCLVDFHSKSGLPVWALYGIHEPIVGEHYALRYPTKGKYPWIKTYRSNRWLYYKDPASTILYRFHWPPPTFASGNKWEPEVVNKNTLFGSYVFGGSTPHERNQTTEVVLQIDHGGFTSPFTYHHYANMGFDEQNRTWKPNPVTARAWTIANDGTATGSQQQIDVSTILPGAANWGWLVGPVEDRTIIVDQYTCCKQNPSTHVNQCITITNLAPNWKLFTQPDEEWNHTIENQALGGPLGQYSKLFAIPYPWIYERVIGDTAWADFSYNRPTTGNCNFLGGVLTWDGVEGWMVRYFAPEADQYNEHWLQGIVTNSSSPNMMGAWEYDGFPMHATLTFSNYRNDNPFDDVSYFPQWPQDYQMTLRCTGGIIPALRELPVLGMGTDPDFSFWQIDGMGLMADRNLVIWGTGMAKAQDWYDAIRVVGNGPLRKMSTVGSNFIAVSRDGNDVLAFAPVNNSPQMSFSTDMGETWERGPYPTVPDRPWTHGGLVFIDELSYGEKP